MDVLSSKADWTVALELANADGSAMNLSGLDIDVAFGIEARTRRYVTTVRSGAGVTFENAATGVIVASVKRAVHAATFVPNAPNNVVADVFILTGRGTLGETRDYIGRAVFALVEGVEQWPL